MILLPVVRVDELEGMYSSTGRRKEELLRSGWMPKVMCLMLEAARDLDRENSAERGPGLVSIA